MAWAAQWRRAFPLSADCARAFQTAPMLQNMKSASAAGGSGIRLQTGQQHAPGRDAAAVSLDAAGPSASRRRRTGGTRAAGEVEDSAFGSSSSEFSDEGDGGRNQDEGPSRSLRPRRNSSGAAPQSGTEAEAKAKAAAAAAETAATAAGRAAETAAATARSEAPRPFVSSIPTLGSSVWHKPHVAAGPSIPQATPAATSGSDGAAASSKRASLGHAPSSVSAAAAPQFDPALPPAARSILEVAACFGVRHEVLQRSSARLKTLLVPAAGPAIFK